MVDDSVTALRRFNRSWSQRVGALDDSFLDTGRPLGLSRLLFELGDDGTAVRQLRERLGLDSGYVSRLLRQLEAEGLVVVGPDPADARRRIAQLTPDGAAARRDLDDRSDVLAQGLVDALSTRQRERLAECLDEADRLIRVATISLDAVDPGSPDARTAVTAYLRELDVTFEEGFDAGQAARDEESFGGAAGRFVVARSEGAAIGCGGLQSLADGTVEIKRMWVHPQWRGLGLAGRLLRRLEAEAVAMGHHVIRLDTNRELTAAIGMYRAAGYLEVPRYNDNPYADFWFEKHL